jgi:hypothetical protein
MKVLLITLLLFTAACSSIDVNDYYENDDIPVAIKKSNSVIKNRSDLLQTATLYKKAKSFEFLLKESMHPRWKLCPKYFTSGKPGPLRTDMTANFLTAIAFKFSVTQAAEDKVLIMQILHTLFEADAANGLDGFLPYKMAIKDDLIKAIRNDTHINVYTQLFFAYVTLLETNNDSEIRQEVLKHLELIISHMESNKFVLIDHNGAAARYSDISPSYFALNGSRKLSLIVFLDLGIKYVPDKALVRRLKKTREIVSAYGYVEDIQDLHFTFLNLEFPTHSSSWLNMMNLYSGAMITDAAYYKTAYNSLNAEYADEQNTLFTLIGKIIKSEGTQLKEIETQLKGFPMNPDNEEILNDASKIQISNKAMYVKKKKRRESAKPLPFYQRPIRSFEWKQNQMRVDGNFKSNGSLDYTGIDFLQAYWMLQYAKKSNHSSISSTSSTFNDSIK